MADQDNQQLKEYFREAGRTARTRAPEFADIWTAVQAKRTQGRSQSITTPWQRPRRALLATLIVLSTALLIVFNALYQGPMREDDSASLLIGDRTSHNTEAEIFNEKMNLALNEWETPTDFLLLDDEDWFFE